VEAFGRSDCKLKLLIESKLLMNFPSGLAEGCFESLLNLTDAYFAGLGGEVALDEDADGVAAAAFEPPRSELPTV
jgi:hypothetical protein